MNIIGIGIDIVENHRLKSKNYKFIEKVLTKKEIKIYDKLIGNFKVEFIAGRFAIKEAIIKATNKKISNMQDIYITNNIDGSPKCEINKNYKFLISISHEKKFTIGMAIYYE